MPDKRLDRNENKPEKMSIIQTVIQETNLYAGFKPQAPCSGRLCGGNYFLLNLVITAAHTITKPRGVRTKTKSNTALITLIISNMILTSFLLVIKVQAKQ
jgi:hypothetical protein